MTDIKICIKCNLSGSPDLFEKGRNVCKSCRKEQKRIYNATHKEKLNQYSRTYHQEHKEEISVRVKKYRKENEEKLAAKRAENKEKLNAGNRRSYQKNKEKIAVQHKKYREENREAKNAQSKEYYQANKENINKKHKEYRQQNREYHRAYGKKYREQYKNKEKINKNRRKRRKNDLAFAFRILFSNAIWRMIKRSDSSKYEQSIMKYLGYTMYQLIDHLTSQMIGENTWMNRNNHGMYKVDTWDDNDPATWTWQIDHIIPQSDLPYSSMEDENFKKCWSLENLRPLSAKQNILDGVLRKRHKKDK